MSVADDDSRDLRRALRGLRHLYEQMVAGHVSGALDHLQSAADGLLAPAIRRVELVADRLGAEPPTDGGPGGPGRGDDPTPSEHELVSRAVRYANSSPVERYRLGGQLRVAAVEYAERSPLDDRWPAIVTGVDAHGTNEAGRLNYAAVRFGRSEAGDPRTTEALIAAALAYAYSRGVRPASEADA